MSSKWWKGVMRRLVKRKPAMDKSRAAGAIIARYHPCSYALDPRPRKVRDRPWRDQEAMCRRASGKNEVRPRFGIR